MSWLTPTLRTVRQIVRDDITAAVAGVSMVGNSVLRVMSDANAGLAHLNLRYLDWQARQYLPDTSEREWLDRHGDIWLTNADSSTGRKLATYATGSAQFSGTGGSQLPAGTQLEGANGVQYETVEQIYISSVSTSVGIIALTAGTIGNLDSGETLSLTSPPSGINTTATVVELVGGTDEESDDDLRARVLTRIRQPPMGGCKTDFEHWALAVPGVTRAWCYPLEMGIGTVTVRIMCDDLRTASDGFPIAEDVTRVIDYIDTVRPVAVKDFFVVSPIRYPINIRITDLDEDTPAIREAIELSVHDMLRAKSGPGQTIYASWVGEAISLAAGENYHETDFTTTQMPSVGHIAILGTIEYE